MVISGTIGAKMGETIPDLILAFGILTLIVGVVVTFFIIPKPWTPRQEWLRRSALVGGIATFTAFLILFSLSFPIGASSDYSSVWNSLPPVLVAAFLLGLFLTVMIYIRVHLWTRYDRFLRNLSTTPRDKNKDKKQ